MIFLLELQLLSGARVSQRALSSRLVPDEPGDGWVIQFAKRENLFLFWVLKYTPLISVHILMPVRDGNQAKGGLSASP